jgi:CRP-like cAMP-binding protein
MKTNILIIEDNESVRENTAEILELAGYHVETAVNGKEGVEKASLIQPDLIICDIMMPVLDGYGVLHMLSRSKATSAIPFIFLSAKTERADLRKGMEMGADDYITKPFEEIELLNAVESRLRKISALRKEIAPNREGLSAMIATVEGIEDIRKVSERQQVRHYRKKDIIYREGDIPAGLYLLQQGKAKTYKSHELGKDLIIRLLQSGDFFGYLSILEDKPQLENAEAMEDCDVIIFPKEDFLKLLNEQPIIAQQFVKMLAENMIEEQDRLLSLAYSSVRKRVATALLELKQRYQKEDDKIFSMAVSREDLANMVGTATESLIRTLSDFRSEGLVEISGSVISLISPEKLERMKN